MSLSVYSFVWNQLQDYVHSEFAPIQWRTFGKSRKYLVMDMPSLCLNATAFPVDWVTGSGHFRCARTDDFLRLRRMRVLAQSDLNHPLNAGVLGYVTILCEVQTDAWDD